MSKKIKYETIETLKEVLTTMKSLSITNCKILNGVIRAASADITLSVITETDKFDDINIGIPDVNLLLSRLNTFDSSATYSADFGDEQVVKQLFVRQGRMKSTFTAVNPTLIKAPSKIEFNEMASFDLSVEDVKMIRNTSSTVSDKFVILKSDQQNIYWYNGDATLDNVSLELLNPVASSPFMFKYDMKAVVTLVRLIESGITVSISDRGFMKFKAQGLDVIAIPIITGGN